MLTVLVHRAFLLVGTTRHALLSRGEPALALGEVTTTDHKGHDERREAAKGPQHPSRMLKPAW